MKKMQYKPKEDNIKKLKQYFSKIVKYENEKNNKSVSTLFK
jgi:hypothetical protein